VNDTTRAASLTARMTSRRALIHVEGLILGMETGELIGNVLVVLGTLLIVALVAGALTLRSGGCPSIQRGPWTNTPTQCHVSFNR
jgi:hypothetical protein